VLWIGAPVGICLVEGAGRPLGVLRNLIEFGRGFLLALDACLTRGAHQFGYPSEPAVNAPKYHAQQQSYDRKQEDEGPHHPSLCAARFSSGEIAASISVVILKVFPVQHV
jgi:hypothetical protein